jgi:hypothetical protein
MGTISNPSWGVPLKLSIRELRVVRAALLLAVEDDSSAWEALPSEDVDKAMSLLDAIPDLSSDVALEDEPVKDGDGGVDY